MPRLVEPRVFMIAKTKADPAQVDSWLAHIGVGEEWRNKFLEENCMPSPEAIVALAAKRCYMSFEPGLNPNVTRVREDWVAYFDNVLSSGHGSVLEHAVFTFAIEGVSRVFTAQMNRHRAGWGVSEGSGHFIRFGDSLPYWVPPVFQGKDVLSKEEIERLRMGFKHPRELADNSELTEDERKHATRVLMQESFSVIERIYAQMVALWDLDSPDMPFKRKKEVTTGLRRVVPIGAATGGVWTGNLRALRHVVALRCAEGNDEEVMTVFSEIARQMCSECPRAFGDFAMVDGYWRPKYPKV